MSNWKTDKVKNFSNMFSGCSSLISFPYTSKFIISNFDNIYSLLKENSTYKSAQNIKASNILLFDEKPDLSDQSSEEELTNKSVVEKYNNAYFGLNNPNYFIITIIIPLDKKKHGSKILNPDFVNKYKKNAKFFIKIKYIIYKAYFQQNI